MRSVLLKVFFSPSTILTRSMMLSLFDIIAMIGTPISQIGSPDQA